MINKRNLALGIVFSLFAVASVAAAAPAADKQCDGKQGAGEHGKGKHGGHFKKADKNGDGFLTQAEVGDKRWARIKVADANNDAKVSMAEMKQAHKDGKLGHPRGQGPKS